MNNNLEELLGSWVQAIGTVIDAISNTPSRKLSEELQTNLSITGNVMQATGNALLADSDNTLDFEKIGNIIQSIGNLTVVSGILIMSDEKRETEFEIKGNLLQTLGNLLSPFNFSVDDKSSYKENLLLDVGSILQAIGNSLQAMAGILKLQGKEQGNLNLVGGWIQASGAVLQALVQSKK
jgi:hypothetical protein